MVYIKKYIFINKKRNNMLNIKKLKKKYKTRYALNIIFCYFY